MASSPPRGLKWRSSTAFIVSTVAIGLFTDLFLYGLVVPILPFVLEDRIHVPPSQLQSYVSGLLAVYAGAALLFSPFAGVVADRLATRQLPFLVGLAALLFATLLLLLGRTIPVLVVARLLQGMSAAVVWAIGLALAYDTVGPKNLGKTIGSIFGFISIGQLAAPVLGGVIYGKSGDMGVFGLGFAVLAIDFIMRLLLIEKKTAARYESESTTSVPQDQSESASADEAEDEPLIKNDENLYRISKEQPKIIKMFPILYCARSPRWLTAQFNTFVQATLLAGIDATVPIVAYEYYGFTSLKGGLLFIPVVVPYLVMGPIGGWMVDRFGPRPGAVLSFGLFVPILALFQLVQPGGSLQIGIYCLLLALYGLALGGVGSPSVVEGAFVVQKYEEFNPEFFGENGPYAQLYAITNMFFNAGLTVGPLFCGLAKERIGYGNMNLILAVLCLLTAFLSYIFLGDGAKILKKGL